MENTNSLWEQAVVIGSSRDKKSSINGFKGKVHYFWLDKASHEYIVEYQTQNDYLYICNGWKTEDWTVLRWTGSCGMMIEEIENGRRYRCNDGFPDCDFDELTFRIERLYEN